MTGPELIRWGLWDYDSFVKPAAQYSLAIKNPNETSGIIRKGIENETRTSLCCYLSSPK